MTTKTRNTTALTHVKALVVLAFPPLGQCQPSEKGKSNLNNIMKIVLTSWIPEMIQGAIL